MFDRKRSESSKL